MSSESILRQISSLPPEKQREVLDFIAFLQEKGSTFKRPRKSLKKEPFIGMWQGRAEMADSSKWVKTLRRANWANNG